jgi:GNAT superfamily N-acetyltransferase
MSITITPVRSKKDLDTFIRLVWPIYRGDPNWVPPVIADRRKLLDRARNPFYQHAEMELFIARRDGEPVGRIAAIINRNHNEEHGDRVGFFGFFETVNDTAVAHPLLAAAEGWLLERGMTAMRGPVNPSMNDETGLLVEGFDDPPNILMTYNPKYYSSVIESFGLTKVKDLYAYWLDAGTFVTPKLERVQARVRERDGVTIRTVKFSPKEAFLKDIETIRQIYNEAWVPTWGFVKMTDEEFSFAASDLRQIAERDLVIFAEKDGRTVGFALGLPDINQALIDNRRGGMIGAGLRLLLGKRKIRRGRIVILGVLPELQRRGIDAVLYHEIGSRMVNDHGYVGGEASWVLEDNVMMRRAAELLGGTISKTYRLYEKSMTKN